MSGVDLPNLFPNSFMALAVKNGHSRMVSDDTPSKEVGEQNNVSIVAATTLTIPPTALYCTVQALGGAANYTEDGSTPSAANGQLLAQGSVLPLFGNAMSTFKIIGTTMAVIYYR